MRKQAGVVKIDRYVHPKFTHIAVDIRMDKDDGQFSAEYNGEVMLSMNLAQLKNRLSTAIEAANAISWKPVISIATMFGKHSSIDQDPEEFSPPRESDGEFEAQLRLSVDRFWVGQDSEGSWYLNKNWDVEDKLHGMTKVRTFEGIGNEYDTHFDGKGWIVNYTPELWDGLWRIRTAIAKLSNRIRELAGDDTGRALLSGFGGKLLMPGENDGKRTNRKKRP